MLVTLEIARCAMLVRSGSPLGGAGAARAACGSLSGGAGAAEVTFAVGIRPVSTTPAMRPSVTEVPTRKKRLSMTVFPERSAHFDLARRRRFDLRNGDRQHTVGQVRRDAIAGDRLGELEDAPEAAVAALDLMVVDRVAGRRPGLAGALNRQTRVFDREVHLLAGQPGKLRGDDVSVAGLVHVNRRGPRIRLVARQPLQPLLPRTQIAQGITGHYGGSYLTTNP